MLGIPLRYLLRHAPALVDLAASLDELRGFVPRWARTPPLDLYQGPARHCTVSHRRTRRWRTDGGHRTTYRFSNPTPFSTRVEFSLPPARGPPPPLPCRLPPTSIPLLPSIQFAKAPRPPRQGLPSESFFERTPQASVPLHSARARLRKSTSVAQDQAAANR